MSYPVYTVYSGDVLPIFFDSFDGGTGASITMTGLAVTDIEIYKDGSTTQRASDAGYTLLDTDGIDFDGITGIHGFSIDTGDNTDAGFYAIGSWYHVVVSSVTIDGQTVNFVAAAFRIVAAEAVAGVPVVDIKAISGDTTAADNEESFFDGTGYAGTNNVIPTVTASGLSAAAVDAIWDEPVSGHVTAASFGKYLDSDISANTDHITADYTATEKAAIDLLDDAAGGLADIHTDVADIHTDVSTIAGYLDTEVAAILADTNELQTDWTNAGRLDALIDGIKAKTDSLTFTVANKLDSNVYTWNGTAVHAPGTAGIPIVEIHDPSGVTIGTVTNLTNAPTNGDLTATMKSSVTTAASSSTPALSAAGVDAIWDEVASGHATAGSFGKYLDSDISANTDHITADYTATEKAAIDLLDDVDGGITDIHTVVNDLHTDVADIHTDVATVAGYLDTEVAAILADTNELQTDLVNGGRMDLLIDGIKAKTDNLPAAPAAVGSAMTLADDAITSGKFDETTAFPIKSADNGATAIARPGDKMDIVDAPSSTGVLAIVDAFLTRAFGSVTYTGTTRCVLTALQKLRNKVANSAGTQTVYKENDSTASYTSTITTDADADPVISIDPDS